MKMDQEGTSETAEEGTSGKELDSVTEAEMLRKCYDKGGGTLV